MDDSRRFRSMPFSRPIPDIRLFQTDLETPRSRSWVWSKGKVIQSAQYPINSLPIHFTSIRPTIPEIQLFRNLTSKHPRSRSWVRSKVKVTYYNQYPTNAFPFRFTLIGPTIPEIWRLLETCWEIPGPLYFDPQSACHRPPHGLEPWYHKNPSPYDSTLQEARILQLNQAPSHRPPEIPRRNPHHRGQPVR